MAAQWQKPRFISIYTKPFDTAPDPNVRVDFGQYKKPFHFANWVHGKNRDWTEDAIKELETEEHGAAPALDLAAAVITELHYRVMLDPEFHRVALQYCQQIILDRGYTREVPSDFYGEGTKDWSKHLFVVGAQTPEIWQSRVEAAFEVAVRKAGDHSLWFAGARPPDRDRFTTTNEASDMRTYFMELADRYSGRKFDPRLVRAEPKSSDSIDNVDRFIQDGLDANKPNEVVVITSAFHLPRLSRILDKKLKESHFKVSRLSLVSSENPIEDSKVTRNPHYVKSMIYEVLKHLYSDESAVFPAGEYIERKRQGRA